MARARRVKGIECKGSVIENARRIIEVRLDELLSFSEYVSDPANVTELHDLRIAAKRLRYTLELFRFALPKEVSALIDEIKEVQEHIGDMHDADVMIERVTEIIHADASARTTKLMEIATALDRGTVAQRRHRIRSVMTNTATPRDEAAFYTLIAHRAADRERSYRQFVDVWRRMEATDFRGRLRRSVGIDRPVQLAQPAIVRTAQVDDGLLGPHEQQIESGTT